MTPEESRHHHLETIFSMDEVIYLESLGLAERYANGEISIDDIYSQLKEQGT